MAWGTSRRRREGTTLAAGGGGTINEQHGPRKAEADEVKRQQGPRTVQQCHDKEAGYKDAV